MHLCVCVRGWHVLIDIIHDAVICVRTSSTTTRFNTMKEEGYCYGISCKKILHMHALVCLWIVDKAECMPDTIGK